MVATASTMLPLGTKAPPLALPNVLNGTSVQIEENGSPAHLVAFICNHCPYVIHLLDHLTEYFNEIADDGISVYLVSSNDIDKYPADSPDKMRDLATEYGFRFPYLFDDDQRVAKAYQAACTPDFFIFDHELSLFYRGRYDGSRPGNSMPVTGNDLKEALGRLLSGDVPPKQQQPSMGCNVKWKPGNEPEYFKS
jgi:peroxiredoxin